ncbi:SulP family inorganic anion transporter [Streptomyces sp. SP18ES09]|uniref:SulP family inorganic anion transporter n=1 Tax=Streptomyces sp. SP18ES09 TaxID=3002532 RepID=UPI002E76E75C|nr:SulP family inorganic anion transporter [Streptomyces sp. SP18ES09]MEE1820234.1 SulP family inorganic anion transporter [Streptomyces sp. SP18ES09]
MIRSLSFPRQDFAASLVVFLVALPLCIGVAVASGVPAELGLITGIVGGIVTGLMRGSSLQVSGPAAGLTVLVLEAVRAFGLATLGVIVLAAGLLQIAMGLLRWGRWFRAISLSVVEGMLAGIGLVIIAGQLYAAAGVTAPDSGLGKLAGLPGALVEALGNRTALVSLAVGAGTVLVIVGWRRAPRRARAVPGALVAVLLAALATAVFGLPVPTVRVGGVLEAVHLPGTEALSSLAEPAVLGTVLAFALIASAESLFSAAAVDRLHAGPRTHYDKELVAQGAGNTLCGLLGALPLTAVIVRSSANVEAGARTKASRVLHGFWLLLFVALLPAVLAYIPLAALAGILVHAGWKLIPFKGVLTLWQRHRGEAVVLVATAAAIVAVGMFEGVLIGLALSIGKAAWEASHLRIERSDDESDAIRVRIQGTVTFLRLPQILDSLEALPGDRRVVLDLSGVHHIDHACRAALETWAERHSGADPEAVRAATPPTRREERTTTATNAPN